MLSITLIRALEVAELDKEPICVVVFCAGTAALEVCVLMGFGAVVVVPGGAVVDWDPNIDTTMLETADVAEAAPCGAARTPKSAESSYKRSKV